MKAFAYLAMPMAATILASTGCSKKEQAAALVTQEAGVNVDMGRLYQVFAKSEPAMKALATDAERDFRYGLYDKSLREVQKLGESPNLTPDQKQLVSKVSDELNQVVAKAGANR